MAKRQGLRGSYFPRGSRWIVSFPLPPVTDPATGKRKYPKITETYHTEQQALDRLVELNYQHRTGALKPPEQQAVAEYLHEWLESKHARVRPTTIHAYQYNIAPVIEHLGDIPLAKLDRLIIERWHGTMAAQGLSIRQQALAHDKLSSALNAAVKARRTPYNVCHETNPPRYHAQRAEAMSAEEARRFLAAAYDPANNRGYVRVVVPLIWDMLLATGMRIGEVLALQWADIDAGRKQLHVRRTVTRDASGRRIIGDAPKTRASDRRIPLSDDLLRKLRAHRGAQNERRLRLGVHWQDNDLVFPTHDGGIISSGPVHHRMKTLLAAAGLPPHYRVHGLRHTAATLMLERGVNLIVVRDILGHESLATTSDTYGASTEDSRRRALGELDDLRDTGN